jgi:hypothetical protein
MFGLRLRAIGDVLLDAGHTGGGQRLAHSFAQIAARFDVILIGST